jgi:hypothetical protein
MGIWPACDGRGAVGEEAKNGEHDKISAQPEFKRWLNCEPPTTDDTSIHFTIPGTMLGYGDNIVAR